MILKTNPKGLPLAADYGRVVASLQRLPCQTTNPKGLFCGGELWQIDLLAYIIGEMQS